MLLIGGGSSRLTGSWTSSICYSSNLRAGCPIKQSWSLHSGGRGQSAQGWFNPPEQCLKRVNRPLASHPSPHHVRKAWVTKMFQVWAVNLQQDESNRLLSPAQTMQEVDPALSPGQFDQSQRKNILQSSANDTDVKVFLFQISVLLQNSKTWAMSLALFFSSSFCDF